MFWNHLDFNRLARVLCRFAVRWQHTGQSKRGFRNNSLHSVLKHGLTQHRVCSVQLLRFSILCVKVQQESSPTLISTVEPTNMLNWSHAISCWLLCWMQLLNLICFVCLFFGRELKMAYLLMFVTLLHLITLAMLFIATMEKVVVIFRIWWLFTLTELFHKCKISSCVLSNLSLKSWWVWDGMENSDLWYNCRFDNFTGTWLCASSKETGKQQFHFVYLQKKGGFTWTVFFSR